MHTILKHNYCKIGGYTFHKYFAGWVTRKWQGHHLQLLFPWMGPPDWPDWAGGIPGIRVTTAIFTIKILITYVFIPYVMQKSHILIHIPFVLTVVLHWVTLASATHWPVLFQSPHISFWWHPCVTICLYGVCFLQNFFMRECTSSSQLPSVCSSRPWIKPTQSLSHCKNNMFLKSTIHFMHLGNEIKICLNTRTF